MLTKNELTDIYERSYNRLFHSSVRIVGDRMAAEEVVHDTLLKFWKFEKSLTREQQEAWLHKSCIRASIDRVRKGLYMGEEIEDEISEQEDDSFLDNDSDIAEKVARIKSAIRDLPEGYRVILSLHLFEGFDYQEISDILNISESTVRSQYMRGKRKLIELIERF